MKEECRSNFHKFETRERLRNKPKKVVDLQFLSSESRSWVKLTRHQPLIHHKYVTIKEQPKKEKLVVYSRIFWLRLMSTQYSFTCKIFWGHMSHIFIMIPSIKLYLYEYIIIMNLNHLIWITQIQVTIF